MFGVLTNIKEVNYEGILTQLILIERKKSLVHAFDSYR